MLLRIAGAPVHLVVAAAAAGMAGGDGGEHFRGGRSTGTLGQRLDAREDELRVATEPCGLAEHGGGLECVVDAL